MATLKLNKNSPLPRKNRFSMMYLWIATRNLTVRKKRSGLSFMTVMSILGVTVGVGALIVVLSVMGGFEEDLKDKMLKGQPHVEVVHKTAALGFGLRDLSLAKLNEVFPEALEIQPFTQMDVVLKQNRHMASGVLFGIDDERETHLWGFHGAIVDGNLKEIGLNHKPALAAIDDESVYPGIAMGDELALQLGADIGDLITVLSPNARAGAALSGGTVAHQFVLVAKFKTGLFNYDGKWAVVTLGNGRKFMPDYDPTLDDEEYVTGVAFNLADPFAVDKLEERLSTLQSDKETSGVLGDLALLTWKKVNKSLLFALKLEKFAMGSILLLIVVVAAFSISSTMMMMVFHKRSQVSLLRSLGMTRRDIKKIYLSHGFMIGTVGIALGLGVGLGINKVIETLKIFKLPEGVYHLTRLPVKWLWADYAVICLFAWIFAVAASLYPAITAARQDPGVGLRHH